MTTQTSDTDAEFQARCIEAGMDYITYYQCAKGEGRVPVHYAVYTQPKFSPPQPPQSPQLPPDTTQQSEPQVISSEVCENKKQPDSSWRELCAFAGTIQDITHRASYSQDNASYDFTKLTKPLWILPISDWHFGSFGTDYEAIVKRTDFILSTPDLYIAIIGDMQQMAIKLRGVLEVVDNLYSPKLQDAWLKSWWKDIQSKCLWSTWDNHSVMREENAAGTSRYAEIFGEGTVYFSGIGHIDLKVGNQVYTVASSHRFPGSSIYNELHGPMRYVKFTAPDRHIVIQGDTHIPGCHQSLYGGVLRTYINCGNLQPKSGYANRFFSLNKYEAFPALELMHDRFEVVTYWNAETMVRKG